MPFDFDNLRVFLAAVDNGSFSAAARALKRVPSAISMTIGNLEAELDLQLFDRSAREPRLTPKGQALVPQARLLLEQLQKLNVHAHALSRQLESALTIVIVHELFGAIPWSGALYTLSEEYPLLEVEVLVAPQADALSMIAAGRAHVAIGYERYGLGSGTEFEELAKEDLVAVISSTHPLLTGSEAGAIRDDALIAERQILVAGRHSEAIDNRISISRRQWKTDNPVTALEMVAAGAGWAWLPFSFVQGPLAEGRISTIPFENFSNTLSLYVDVIWNTEKSLGLAAHRFVQLLKARDA